MAAHIHAALMGEYAKDAAECEHPWERWEYRAKDQYGQWYCIGNSHPTWSVDYEYRRKRTPLCQVEGRDVFPGDKLWSKTRGEWVIVGGKFADSDSHLRVGSHDSEWPDNLSWTAPPKTKTVYQWAYQMPKKPWWNITGSFYETELEAMTNSGSKSVIRLDYTAIEVPA